jgi:hypothetical protein
MTGAHSIARLAGILALGSVLCGFMSYDVEIAVQSETEARQTVTVAVDAEIKALLAQAELLYGPEAAWCGEGELADTADGGSTCVTVSQGSLAELTAEEQGALVYSATGNGEVRVAFFPAILAELTGLTELAAEAAPPAEAPVGGTAITLRVVGRDIVETNLASVVGNTTAEQVVTVFDLIQGGAALPNEFYAVVRVQ